MKARDMINEVASGSDATDAVNRIATTEATIYSRTQAIDKAIAATKELAKRATEVAGKLDKVRKNDTRLKYFVSSLEGDVESIKKMIDIALKSDKQY